MRIKYGGGVGHTQSLQNYQYEKGDNATLGNRVQTRARWWGSRQGRPQTPRASPTPTPCQMDWSQPWRAIWGRREPLSRGECEDGEAFG